MTLPPSMNNLPPAISRLIAEKTAVRLAVLGVGQELRGDDAAGIIAARRLSHLADNRDWLLVIEAGPVPENFVGSLRDFHPDLVILLDAARLDLAPGLTAWLDQKQITGISAFTHSLPLSIFTRYLLVEMGCTVTLLGIQPRSTAFDASLSAEVESGVAAVVSTLKALITELETTHI